ncbi:uncharacterized protein WCC33_009880 [Rhinophrynus dorsalis]
MRSWVINRRVGVDQSSLPSLTPPKENRLYAKLEKCAFEVDRVAFLGYIIGSTGFEMNPSKLDSILNWPQFSGIKPLQLFLGFANYYYKFITDFSEIAAPLTVLTKRGTDCVNWPPEAVKAFNRLKQKFSTAPVLRHADPTQPFGIEVDASETGAGAMLSQWCSYSSPLHPCRFMSKSFTQAKRIYDVANRELLAIILALEE